MDRNSLETLVKGVLGKSNSDIVKVLEKASSRDYDKRKTKDRLREVLTEDSKVSKLVEKFMDQKRTATTSNGSSKKRPRFEEVKRDVSSSQNGSSANVDSVVKKEADDKTHVAAQLLAVGKAKEDLKVKELMAQAQKSIDERKRQLNIPTKTPVLTGIGTASAAAVAAASFSSTKLAPVEAEQFMAQAMEKAKRAAELRAKIAERTATLSTNSAIIGLSKVPKLVEDGRSILDAGGKPIGLPQPKPTLKANIREEKRELFRKAQLETEQELATGVAAGSSTDSAIAGEVAAFVDPRVVLKSAQRTRRLFQFKEKGEFERLANQQRAKAKLERLQAEISLTAKKTGISSAVKLAMVAPKTTDSTEVPLVEWWDNLVLAEGTDAANITEESVGLDDIADATITNLVEHPIQLRPPDEPTQVQYLKIYLTKKEMKKIRRQNRKEAQREKTEKIRLGLEPPPEPKMKISNLMRVLGTDAIQDPTKMEAHVRSQMANRMKKHEESNEARKLTPEQRALKKAQKVQEDTTLGVHVAVYRIADLTHPSKKFKVEMNAKQLTMTGIIVLHKDVNIVVVEGGPKQQKFFKRLMLHRIKWEEEKVGHTTGAAKRAAAAADGDDASSAAERAPANKCHLVWEGLSKRRLFGDVRCKPCPLEKQARELFEKHDCAHYWDMAFSGAILTQEDDDELAV